MIEVVWVCSCTVPWISWQTSWKTSLLGTVHWCGQFGDDTTHQMFSFLSFSKLCYTRMLCQMWWISDRPTLPGSFVLFLWIVFFLFFNMKKTQQKKTLKTNLWFRKYIRPLQSSGKFGKWLNKTGDINSLWNKKCFGFFFLITKCEVP